MSCKILNGFKKSYYFLGLSSLFLKKCKQSSKPGAAVFLHEQKNKETQGFCIVKSFSFKGL